MYLYINMCESTRIHTFVRQADWILICCHTVREIFNENAKQLRLQFPLFFSILPSKKFSMSHQYFNCLVVVVFLEGWLFCFDLVGRK